MTEAELQLFLDAKLSEIADTLMAYYNPCDIKGSSCRAGDPNPCCHNTVFGKGLCPHWKGKCTFPNLDCKTFFCDVAMREADPRCFEAFRVLEQLAKLYGLVAPPYLGKRNSMANRLK